jgi:hypothetical protein
VYHRSFILSSLYTNTYWLGVSSSTNPRTMITTVVNVKNRHVYCRLRSFTIRWNTAVKRSLPNGSNTIKNGRLQLRLIDLGRRIHIFSTLAMTKKMEDQPRPLVNLKLNYFLIINHFFSGKFLELLKNVNELMLPTKMILIMINIKNYC